MKKLALTIALVSTMVLGAQAQRGKYDSFVSEWSNDFRDNDNSINFVLPINHGLNNDSNAPLGSGLWVLTAIGAGYVVKRRKK